MSKLHERLLKHRHMSLEEKENCTCDMCKGLNVYRKRRVEMNMQKAEIPTQNPKTVKLDA